MDLPTLHTVPDASPVKRLLLKKCLPKVKHFSQEKTGVTQFVHDVLDALAHRQFDESRYKDISASDWRTLLEGFKFFFCQVISLNLTQDQVLQATKLQLLTVGRLKETYEIVACQMNIKHKSQDAFLGAGKRSNTSWHRTALPSTKLI